MITSIRFENFFSFKDHEVALNAGLNVLIGINGSGKSNFLKGLEILTAAVKGNLKALIVDDWGGMENVRHSSSNAEDAVKLTFTFNKGALSTFGHAFATANPTYFLALRQYPNYGDYYIAQEALFIGEDLYLDIQNGKGVVYGSTETALGRQEAQFQDLNNRESALLEISDQERYTHIYALKKALQDFAVYNFLNIAPNSKTRRAVVATSEKRLAPDGENLAQMINTLKISDRLHFKETIIKDLQEVNPNFEDIDFNFFGGSIELLLAEKHIRRPIHPRHISDGTLLYLAVLSILHNPQRGCVAAIDEPDIRLHPDMIHNLAKAMLNAAKTSQLVVATHSPILLNMFELEDLLIFEKGPDNSTKVIKKTEAEFGNEPGELLPGKLWLGGLLGGVRYGN